MTLGVRAHDSAILRAANWIRSNSYSGMFRSRPLKDTWVANRGFYTPSTTRWELNRRVSADCDELLAKGAEKAAPCRQGMLYFLERRFRGARAPSGALKILSTSPGCQLHVYFYAAWASQAQFMKGRFLGGI